MVNEDLFLYKPLHVIQNHSKLAYRIYVILIDKKEFFKKNIYIYILGKDMERRDRATFYVNLVGNVKKLGKEIRTPGFQSGT
jgi:hypothetical protein